MSGLPGKRVGSIEVVALLILLRPAKSEKQVLQANIGLYGRLE